MVNKYLRTITSCVTGDSIEVDVYDVIEAFGVTCPARQHAIKKLLCAGLRGKGSEMQDLEEAINSCGPRILQLQRQREAQPITIERKQRGRPRSNQMESSEKMKRARELVESGYTAYKAAQIVGFAMTNIYRSQWYIEMRKAQKETES